MNNDRLKPRSIISRARVLSAPPPRRWAPWVISGGALLLSGVSLMIVSFSLEPQNRLPIIVPFGIVALVVTVALFVVSRLEVNSHRRAHSALRSLNESRMEVAALNEQLERTVQERTAQLRATNHGLESFTYSVSHDLRAPLRSIDGFSSFLLEDYGNRLDDTGRDYLYRIRRATSRMDQLIDDLLDLSRVTRVEMRREPVDLSDLAAGCIDELREAEPDRDVTVHVEPNLYAEGERSLLRILMLQLIGNAWKFTRDTDEPLIEIGKEHRDGKRTYFVRDNGAGFDQEYSDHLFESFRRLHSPHEYPGTGIGLAIAQKVVDRHSGTIHGEGEPGKGATFRFTLFDETSGRVDDVGTSKQPPIDDKTFSAETWKS